MLIAALASVVIGVIVIALHAINIEKDFPNDSVRYVIMSKGGRTSKPFCYRWLWPKLIGNRLGLWNWLSMGMMVALGPLMIWWLAPLGPVKAIFGVVLYYGLGHIHLLVKNPKIIDQPALVLMVLGACLFRDVHPVAGVIVAVIGAAVSEVVPIMIAAFVWSPLPLIGMISYGAARLLIKPVSDPLNQDEVLDHPIRGAFSHRAGNWFNPYPMLLPWGLALPLAMLNPTPWLFTTLALGYAQTMLALDISRLYLRAAPVVIYVAASGIDIKYIALVALLHTFNPWRWNS